MIRAFVSRNDVVCGPWQRFTAAVVLYILFYVHRGGLSGPEIYPSRFTGLGRRRERIIGGTENAFEQSNGFAGPRMADNIPEDFEVLPWSGLIGPKFWKSGRDAKMYTVNEKETIFVMMAAFRDLKCLTTVESAFKRALHPERLFIGVVEQRYEEDPSCRPRCTGTNQMFACKYIANIVIFPLNADQSSGPVTARHLGYRLYRGQKFFLQIDSHTEFVRNWDKIVILEWRKANNEMAVLTTYVMQAPATDSQGNMYRHKGITAYMCNAHVNNVSGVPTITYGAAHVIAVKTPTPLLQPYWGAGFSFSMAHFLVNVPVDPYIGGIFSGEQININVRGFTYGYDFYTPSTNVVFHYYTGDENKKKRCPKEGDKFVELNPGEYDWAVSEADCRAYVKGKGLTMRSTPSLARPKGCSRGSGGYVWNDNFDTSVGCVNNNNIYCVERCSPGHWTKVKKNKHQFDYKSMLRCNGAIGFGNTNNERWDKAELDTYGIGNVRTPALFYKLFGIDTEHMTVKDMCSFMTSGKLHDQYLNYTNVAFGVNYSKFLEDKRT